MTCQGRSTARFYCPTYFSTPAVLSSGSNRSSTSSLRRCKDLKITCRAGIEGTEDVIRNNSFDWRLALALAGCAFEAYNGLDEQGNPCLHQVSVGGTEVTYVSKDFLDEKMDGLLEVLVTSASDLQNKDGIPFALSDPYCQVSVGSSSARTRTIKHNLNPVWNESLFLFVRDLKKQKMFVRLFDDDVFESDDSLGYSMRGLADLGDGEAHDVEFDLLDGTGKIKLRLQFFPFNEASKLAEALSRGTMGGPVLGSPANALLSSPWKNLKQLLIPAEAAADAAFDPICYVDNPQSDTQVWLFWNEKTRYLVISFRGTEQTKLKDIITDVSLAPATLDEERLHTKLQTQSSQSEAGFAEKGFGAVVGALAYGRQSFERIFSASTSEAALDSDGDRSDEMWVHAGFLQAYESVRVDILQIIDALLDGEKRTWTIYCTGHSLGGALSVLCAYDLASRPRKAWYEDQKPTVVNYNFGSPRVGNSSFAYSYNQLVPNTWRVVNDADAVTLVPRLLGYAHVGEKLTLSNDGLVDFGDDGANSDLGEGDTVTDVAANIATILLKQGLSNEDAQEEIEELGALIEAEKEALSGLLDGSGMAEHLEPLYLERLESAIRKHFQRSV